MVDGARHQTILKLAAEDRLSSVLRQPRELFSLHLLVLLRRLRAEDSVRLARARLPIRHDDTIKAIEHVLHDGPRHRVVALGLQRVRLEYMIKEEVSLVVVGPNER